MVNIADTYFEWQTLIQKWERPDFSRWVPADRAADYLESLGQYDKAQEARKVQQLSNYPVAFTIVPPGIAAYVTPWSSGSMFYNLHTLGRNADHEHIVRHESIHLEHQSRWWSTDLPGFSELNPFAQSCFATALGTSFTERMLLEGLTESKATEQTEYDPDCSYNLKEVPISERFDALVKNRSALSGLDFSTNKSFARMGESGSRDGFKNAIILTANQLMLEQAAADMDSKVDDGIATKISYIARDLLQSGKVIQSMDEAKEILKTKPVGTLEITVKKKDRVNEIGIRAWETPAIKKNLEKNEIAVNISGDILKKWADGKHKVEATQTQFADKLINVVQLPGNAPSPAEILKN